MHFQVDRVILENVGCYRGVRVERDFTDLPDGLIQYKGSPGAGKTTEMSLTSVGTWFQWDPNRGDPMDKFTNPGKGLVEIHGWAQGRRFRWVTEYTVREITRGKRKGDLDKSRKCYVYEWKNGAWVIDPLCASGQIGAFLAKNEELFGPREYALHTVYGFQRGGARLQKSAESFDEAEPRNRKRFFRDLLGLDGITRVLEAATARAGEAESELAVLLPDLQRMDALIADVVGLESTMRLLLEAAEGAEQELVRAKDALEASIGTEDALRARAQEVLAFGAKRDALNAELATLTAEISRLAAMRSSLQQASERLVAAQKNAAAAQLSLDDARTAAAAADQAKRRYEEAQRAIASIRADITKTTAERALVQDRFAALERQLIKAAADLPAAKTAESAARTALDLASSKASAAESMAARIADAKADAQRISTECAAKEAALVRTASDAAKTEAARVSLAADAENKQRQATIAEETLATLAKARETKLEEYGLANAAKTVAANAHNQHMMASAEAARALDTAKHRAEQARREVVTLTQRRESLAATAAMLDTVPCHGEGQYSGCRLLQAAVSAKAQIPQVDTEIAAAQAAQIAAEQELQACEDRASQIKAKADETAKALDTAEAQCKSILDAGLALKAQISNAEITVTGVRRMHAAAVADLADNQRKLAALQAQHQAEQAACDALRVSKAEADARLAALPQPDPNAADDVRRSKTEHEAAAATVRALEAALAKQGERDELSERLASLDARVQTLTSAESEAVATMPPAPDTDALTRVTQLEQALQVANAAVSEALSGVTAAERMVAASETRIASMRTADVIVSDIESIPNTPAPTDEEFAQARESVTTVETEAEDLAGRLATIRQEISETVGAKQQLQAQIGAMEVLKDKAAVIRDTIRLRSEICQDIQSVLKYSIEAAGPDVSARANELLRAGFGDRWTIEIVTEIPNKSNDGTKERYEIFVHDAHPEHSRSCLLQDLSGGEQSIVRLALMLGVALWRNGQSPWRATEVRLDEPDASLNDDFRGPFQVMLRKFLEDGGFRRIYLTSHGMSIEADYVIDVEDRSAWMLVDSSSDEEPAEEAA